MYCKKCGGKLESYASNCAFCGTPVEKYDDTVRYVKPKQKEKKQEPMTTAKWIGLTFLPTIPVIGVIVYLVLMFKWAFGSHNDLTLKGFARANLIMMVLAIILIVGLSVLVILFFPELADKLKTKF